MQNFPFISNSFFDRDGNQNLEYILVLLILLFFFSALVFFAMIIYSRIGKIARAKAAEAAIPRFENMLLSFLFNETDLQKLLGEQGLRKPLKRRWMRNLLLDEVLKLHNNFSGDYNHKLELFYVESNLMAESLRKMKSRKWHIRCKGIRELTQMKAVSASASIERYTRSSVTELRREARLSMLKLKGFEGLSFLKDYPHLISEWDQLNFIAILLRLQDEDPVDFSFLLSSSNPSVRALGLRLITEFSQVSSAGAVLDVFKQADEKTKLLAVIALSRLRYAEAIPAMTEQYTGASPKLKRAILEALGEMENEELKEFFLKEAACGNYEEKFLAAKALVKTDSLEELSGMTEADAELQEIMKHVNNKRLNV